MSSKADLGGAEEFIGMTPRFVTKMIEQGAREQRPCLLDASGRQHRPWASRKNRQTLKVQRTARGELLV